MNDVNVLELLADLRKLFSIHPGLMQYAFIDVILLFLYKEIITLCIREC